MSSVKGPPTALQQFRGAVDLGHAVACSKSARIILFRPHSGSVNYHLSKSRKKLEIFYSWYWRLWGYEIDFLGDALRRVLAALSTGLLLPGGNGIRDPCEREETDASATLTNQQREDITFTSQAYLRLISFMVSWKLEWKISFEKFFLANSCNAGNRKIRQITFQVQYRLNLLPIVRKIQLLGFTLLWNLWKFQDSTINWTKLYILKITRFFLLSRIFLQHFYRY